jgi:putative ATP-binding cassette transporter
VNASEKNLFQKAIFLIKPFWKGQSAKNAWFLLIIAIIFVIFLSGINTYKTYVTKWMLDALTERNSQHIINIFIIAIISLGISIPISAYHNYTLNNLHLHWRKWLNLDLLGNYFKKHAFYRMHLFSDVDNPDQRLSSDLEQFVNLSVQFIGVLCFSVISIITLTGVLWMINIWLVVCIVIYVAIGSAITLLISKNLVDVNFKNIQYEADYRYNLVHVRDNVESIAFYQGENHEHSGLKERFLKLMKKYQRLIKLQRNISFFTEFYLLYAALCPFLILFPGVLNGTVTIGTVVQASTVFMLLLQSFSVIVNYFKELATYGAVVERLYGFAQGINTQAPESTKTEVVTKNNFSLNDVTIYTPDLKKTLAKNLSIEIPKNSGILIMGPSGCGKSSLLRALAGLWRAGSGTINIPPIEEVMFLPQKPYMIIGSLREQITYPQIDQKVSDEELFKALKKANLDHIPEQTGGLDKTLNWGDILSLGEQQRLIFARLFLTDPAYAILDESTSALDEPNEENLYQQLVNGNIGFISVGHRSSLKKFHTHILEMDQDGKWEFYPTVNTGKSSV